MLLNTWQFFIACSCEYRWVRDVKDLGLVIASYSNLYRVVNNILLGNHIILIKYKVVQIWPRLIFFFLKTLITKVAQLLRSAACLQKNQSRSYLNHLVHENNIHKYIVNIDNDMKRVLFFG
jgi:hypothetical protein